MDYVEALQRRYSAKKFDSGKKVAADILHRILEAGKLSASSLGLQPYRLIVVQSAQKLKEITPAFYNPSQISTCSHLIAVVVRKGIDDDYVDRYFNHIANVRELKLETLSSFRNSINFYKASYTEDQILNWNEKQAFIVLGNLIFAAALEQVDTCPMEGFKPDVLEDLFKINTETEKISVTLALGYSSADDPFRHHKKVRKPDEFLYEFI